MKLNRRDMIACKPIQSDLRLSALTGIHRNFNEANADAKAIEENNNDRI